MLRQLGSPRSKGPSSKLDELDAALGLAADGAADTKRVLVNAFKSLLSAIIFKIFTTT